MTPAELARILSDQEYRLNNLYYITDKDGKKVQFKMNRAQAKFFRNMHYKNIILKARQLGFSTFIQLYLLDVALFYPDTNLGIVAQTLDDATELFRTKILYAFDNLPAPIRDHIQVLNRNTTELILGNGSAIRVGVSLRSGTYQYIHISEFGKIAAKFPDRAREIVTGALNTLAPGCFAFIESTAEGNEGRYYEMVQQARSIENTSTKLTAMDWKFHFFPWYEDPAYVLEPNGVIIPPSIDKYFTTLENEHQVYLSKEQKAWYAKKAEEQKDDMGREFPSTPDEAFAVAIEGAFYGDYLADAEKQGRITSVPYNPVLDVETWWDLGMRDMMAIWFVQRTRGGEIRVIDYYENSGEGLAHYAQVLRSRGYRYSRHVGPHDSSVRELSGDGKSRQEVAESMGMKPWIITARASVDTGINAVRNILPMCFFDAEKCADGIKALKHYRKEWDDKMATWKGPRHDWASHASDAFRYGALAPDAMPELGAFNQVLELPNLGHV